MGSASEPPNTGCGFAQRRRMARDISLVGSTDHHLLLLPFHPRHAQRFRQPSADDGTPHRCVIMAHTMRAILLARATAATLRGRRSSKAKSQALAAGCLV